MRFPTRAVSKSSDLVSSAKLILIRFILNTLGSSSQCVSSGLTFCYKWLPICVNPLENSGRRYK